LFATLTPEQALAGSKKAYFDVPEPIPGDRLPAVTMTSAR
jgi:hypothetical protein